MSDHGEKNGAPKKKVLSVILLTLQGGSELGKEVTQCLCYNPAWAVSAPEAEHSSRAGERKVGKVSFRSWEQWKWKREGKMIGKYTDEGFCFDMLRVLVSHLANQKDNDVSLYLFIWVLEWQEILVLFGEILRKKIFVLLYLFYFPGVWGKGLNIFLSKVLLHERFKMIKCWTMKTWLLKTDVSGPLSLNVACHFKGTKARWISCPRCLDSVEQSHMVFWTKLPIP